MEPAPLYHVTTADRLPRISRAGLVPGSRKAIRPPSLNGHAEGRVFLTEAKGVPFWLHRAEMFIEEGFDDYAERGIAPVVLRIQSPPDDLQEDKVGSTDATAKAYFTVTPVPADRLEVWDGRAWAPVVGARLDLSEAFDDLGYLNPVNPLAEPDLTPPQPPVATELSPVTPKGIPVLPSPARPKLTRERSAASLKDAMADRARAAYKLLEEYRAGGGSLGLMPPEVVIPLEGIPGGLEFLEKAEQDFTDRGLKKLLAEKVDEAGRAARRDDVLFSEAVNWLGLSADEIERRMESLPPEEYASLLDYWHRQYRQRFDAPDHGNPHLTEAAYAAMTYAAQHVAKAAYDRLAKLPFRVEFAFPEHDGHLGANSAGKHLGRVRVLAGEDVASGGYLRSRGEPFGTKKVKAFSTLVPVGPGSRYWGALPSLDDVVAADRIGARMRKLPPQVTPETEVSVAV